MPGSRGAFYAALAVAAVTLAVALPLAFATSSGDGSKASTYGQIPSWLPTPKVPVGRLVQASAAHPWLAIEGDTVSVHLSHGRLLAKAVGPAVPEEGKSPVPATSPCSFTVTLTAATGVLPVNAAAFTILDELGHLHHPRVRATGGGAPPQRLAPGQTVSLTISAVLPTGNGQLRWAPEGARPIVAWDFDVEID